MYLNPIHEAIFEMDTYFLVFCRDVQSAKAWFEYEIEERMATIDNMVFENGSNEYELLLNAIDNNSDSEYWSALKTIHREYDWEPFNKINDVILKNVKKLEKDRFFKKGRVYLSRK